ncbi:Ig-like domain-containing protein [Desulfatibacillum aliphaticivorans]|uniref:Ig-like domain-containing protein n=1 Tax=Desulfatibacillum aliphaticivorans TaxID=218208 RepID=UPI001472175E|nr:Ig-like domain-containing protein [Desulfatibacillum aliphaticivorans]
MIMQSRRSCVFSWTAATLVAVFASMGIFPQWALAELQYVPQKESLYFVFQKPYVMDFSKLLAACPETADTDGDGLPDRLEKMLGTDPESSDSDFDRLTDYYEAENGLNPLKPDSNADGLSDYLEVHGGGGLDTDGDGIPNAWDGDNDNDGVYDPLDLSPFACTIAKPEYHFRIHSTGKPTYINIQVRPRDPDRLRLPFQYFDWEDGDDKGTMQDRDNTKEDVCITPALEVTANHLPSTGDLDKYGIYVVDGKAYIPLYTTDHFGSPSAFNGRIFYPATGSARDIDLNARLIWMVTGKTDQGMVAPGNPFSAPSYYSSDTASMGGGLALADINRNGAPDLVFMGVDAADAEDSLSYQIGWDLNAQGYPSSWSAKKTIPSGAWTIQGADLALADLDGNGMQEMILMYVDNPGGSNAFRYQIAWNLDANGDPWTGWGALTQSPQLGAENVGAGIATGDINDNGSRDFLFTAIDADSPDRDFNYYIGWDVGSSSGQPSSWSGMMTAPGVITNTIGAGAELVDLDSNGELDLVLMGIQEQEGADRMFFRVGWNLDSAGTPESWSGVSGGPYFSGLTAGGGIAAGDVDLDGTPDLMLGAIDSTSGTSNRFLARLQSSFSNSMGNAPINLAKYAEDAVLTGFTVEENHGSTVGLFYGDDQGQVLLANTQLGYEFLRGQTSLSQEPGRLGSLGISVNSDVRNFGHQDEAMAALSGAMIPAALGALPPDIVTPVICAFEDQSASVEMSETAPENRYHGNTFVVDMAKAPVSTGKRIVTPWYDTTTQAELGLDEVAGAAYVYAQASGMTGEEKSNLTDMVMAWNAGESAMSRMDEDMDPEPPETSKVMRQLVEGGRSMAAVGRIAVGVRGSYKAAKILRAGFRSMSMLKNFKIMFASVSQAKVGTVSKMDRVIKGAGAMGWVVTAGVAFYAFFQIASSHGWSRLGIFSGAMFATLMTAYAIGLWALSCIPIVGGIISGLVALSDLIMGWVSGTGWSQALMEDIVGFFVTKSELSKVELELIDSAVNITDLDGNGLDVGDKIEITSRFQEYVYRYGPGYTDYWESSYVKPYYELAPGIAAYGDHWETIEDEYWDYDNYYFMRIWKVGVWIEPPAQMPSNNYKFTVYLNSDYKAYYEECSSGCDVHSSSGTVYSEPSTIYFDVLPKNLEQFLGWTVITPLDTDGDGYLDVDQDGDGVPDVELDSNGNICYSCSPHMWDSDVDGLADPYEREVSLTYTNEREGDRDGVPDGVEVVLGTNAKNEFGHESDGDWLLDIYEIQGWNITIPLGDATIPMHVYSDPTKMDTDGDGLPDDWEALYRTNPHSRDTDGDGISDFDEQDINRPIGPPLVSFTGTVGNVEFPSRIVSSIRPDSAFLTLFAWYRPSIEIRALNTIASYTDGIKSDLTGVQEGFYQGGKRCIDFIASGSGVTFIRYFNYWDDYETMPADEDMPIVAVVNTTGGSGWLATGDDKDADGLIDLNEYIGWPVAYHDNQGDQSYVASCDPTMKDTDQDGLTDAQEYAAGTDPRDPDTDHDCLTDKQEVDLGSNPLHSNTDSDPYLDAEEFIAGMNLLSRDSDGDGVIDNVILGAVIDPLANLPMELHNDTAQTPPNQPVTVDVLANDIYYSSGVPTITGTTSPKHGQAVTDGETVTYTPTAGYTGTDYFSYTASHLGKTATAKVNLTVAVPNEAPKAYADTCSVEWKGTTSIVNTYWTSVLHNDVDPEGAPLTVTLTVPPLHGSVTLNMDGTFTYQQDGTAAPQDVFKYTVSDGTHTSNQASVLINIDLTGDADMDGFQDWEEEEAGTLPEDPDTDKDGLMDGDDPYPLLGIGDLNGDRTLGMDDLILGLQILANNAPDFAEIPYNGPGNDVDGDGVIGEGEILFLLRHEAGLNQ